MEYTFYKLSIADKCYVGSTIDFDDRIRQHKNDSKNKNKNSKNYHYKVYEYMRQNGNWENVKVMIIDKIIYNHKDEAREMETKFMLSFNAELNMCYPKRSQKEWYDINKERIIEKAKEYYKSNKEKINKVNKKYREKNKEKVSEKQKEYYETNKQIIAEKQKVKIACDICSKMLSRSSIYNHKKTQHPITDENIHPF
jgi:hypothetical protein